MSNERFYSVCEKYIKFNYKLNRYSIFCDYTHEKKSLRFIFHDTYLKENEIENLRQHIENEKNENKALRSFMNNFKILNKKHIIHDENRDNWWYSKTQ